MASESRLASTRGNTKVPEGESAPSTRRTGEGPRDAAAPLAKEGEEQAFFREGEFGTYAGGPLEFADADDEGHPSLVSIPPPTGSQRLASVATVVVTGAVLLGAVFALADRLGPDDGGTPNAPSAAETSEPESVTGEATAPTQRAETADVQEAAGSTAAGPAELEGARPETPSWKAQDAPKEPADEGDKGIGAASRPDPSDKTTKDVKGDPEEGTTKTAGEAKSPSPAGAPAVKPNSQSPTTRSPTSAKRPVPPKAQAPASKPPAVKPKPAPPPPANKKTGPDKPKPPSASFLGN